MSKESDKIMEYILASGKEKELDSFLAKYKDEMKEDAFNVEKYGCKTIYLCARYFDKDLGARYYYSTGSYTADIIGTDAVTKDEECAQLNGKPVTTKELDRINEKLRQGAFYIDSEGHMQSVSSSSADKIIKVVSLDNEIMLSKVYSENYETKDGNSLKEAESKLNPKMYPYVIGQSKTVDHVPTGHITSNNNLRTSSNELNCIGGKYNCGLKLEWTNRLKSEEITKLIENYNLYDYELDQLMIPSKLHLSKYSYSDLITFSGELLSRKYMEPRELMQVTLCLLDTKEITKSSDRFIPKEVKEPEQLRINRLRPLYGSILDDKGLYLVANAWNHLRSADLATFQNLNPLLLLPFIKEDLAECENLKVRVGFLKERFQWSGIDLDYSAILSAYKYMGNLDFTLDYVLIKSRLKKENVSVEEFSQVCTGPNDVKPTFPEVGYTDDFGYILNDLGDKFEKIDSEQSTVGMNVF